MLRAGFESFAGLSLMMLTLCVVVFVTVTPYSGIRLIPEGNGAGAVGILDAACIEY